MKIGIDISQLAYPNTGVAAYLEHLVFEMVKKDKKNTYVLFFSSLRGIVPASISKLVGQNKHVILKKAKIPPTILSYIWNTIHMMPLEHFVGNVDVFITSDWTEPPTKQAKKATILYDLIVYKYPSETHNQVNFNPFKMAISPNIVASQQRRLEWVKKESSKVFCISNSTAKDAQEILGIPKEKLSVIYPGL